MVVAAEEPKIQPGSINIIAAEIACACKVVEIQSPVSLATRRCFHERLRQEQGFPVSRKSHIHEIPSTLI
jgi:hypothetical protein